MSGATIVGGTPVLSLFRFSTNLASAGTLISSTNWFNSFVTTTISAGYFCNGQCRSTEEHFSSLLHSMGHLANKESTCLWIKGLSTASIYYSKHVLGIQVCIKPHSISNHWAGTGCLNRKTKIIPYHFSQLATSSDTVAEIEHRWSDTRNLRQTWVCRSRLRFKESLG